MNKKKIALIIMLIVGLTIIFIFSSQSSIKSNNNSNKIVGNTIKVIFKVKDKKIPSEEIDKIVEKYNYLTRKTAHFLEYLILSIIICFLLREFKFSNKNIIILTSLLCIFVASIDEINQLYIQDRTGQITDVLIDWFGANVGIAIFFLIKKEKVLKNKKSDKL